MAKSVARGLVVFQRGETSVRRPKTPIGLSVDPLTLSDRLHLDRHGLPDRIVEEIQYRFENTPRNVPTRPSDSSGAAPVECRTESVVGWDEQVVRDPSTATNEGCSQAPAVD